MEEEQKIEMPVVPTVSIKVNGQDIRVPAIPVRSTNANGIVGYDIYETTYKVPATVSTTPAVTASASSPAVKISITQAASKTGTAVVKCDYKGIVKTYKVVLAAE